MLTSRDPLVAVTGSPYGYGSYTPMPWDDPTLGLPGDSGSPLCFLFRRPLNCTDPTGLVAWANLAHRGLKLAAHVGVVAVAATVCVSKIVEPRAFWRAVCSAVSAQRNRSSPATVGTAAGAVLAGDGSATSLVSSSRCSVVDGVSGEMSSVASVIAIAPLSLVIVSLHTEDRRRGLRPTVQMLSRITEPTQRGAGSHPESRVLADAEERAMRFASQAEYARSSLPDPGQWASGAEQAITLRLPSSSSGNALDGPDGQPRSTLKRSAADLRALSPRRS